MAEVGSIVCGIMWKRRDSVVHTVMPLEVIRYMGTVGVRYEDTVGLHIMSVREFCRMFEPLDPSVPGPTCWDWVMDPK